MWLIYGLFGAAGKGFADFFRKKIAGNIDTDVYMWLTLTLSLPIIGMLVALTGDPLLDMIIEKPLDIIAGSLFWIAAIVSYIQAFKREELSYIAPLLAFVPVFTLGLAWLFLGQAPPLLGLAGICVVFVGAYITNLKQDQIKWHDPIIHLTKNSGARYAIVVSICFALVSIVTKNVLNGGYSAITWFLAMYASSWLLLIYVPFTKFKQVKKALHSSRWLIIIATLTALASGLFGILSIEQTDYTAYAISIRRFDILFSIILGWKILGDSNIRNRLAGGVLMIIGVVIISVF